MRHILDILNEASDPFLYHAAHVDNLAAIAREGLTPNTDRDSTFGDGYPIDGRLYVSNYDGAKWYANQLVDLFDRDADEIVLLRFPKKGVRTKTDPFGNLSDRYTTQSIDPSVIELFRGGQWTPII